VTLAISDWTEITYFEVKLVVNYKIKQNDFLSLLEEIRYTSKNLEFLFP